MTRNEFMRGIAGLAGLGLTSGKLDERAAQLYTQIKGEPVMPKAEEPLLPKDLLADLESGDRSNEFLEISKNDHITAMEPGTSLSQAFANAQMQNEQLAGAFGSSFMSANIMGLGAVSPGSLVRFK